ncbi:MAG: excinuclease ABC subunit UvrA [Verrucomicrobiota bacterium]
MSSIRVTGARQHNLQNLSVEIPRNQLVVLTGVSGSGKSSLAFDTLFAEGQRRYVESLSAYARQFLDQLEKPEVDFIEGLAPAIAIEQRRGSQNPRSTIATVTEILDYLRILYAHVGQPHDPETGEALVRSTPGDMRTALTQLPEGSKLLLLAPLPLEPGWTPSELFADLRRKGFLRIRLNRETCSLDPPPEIQPDQIESIEIVIDRLIVREGFASRLADSLETGLRENPELLRASIQKPGQSAWEDLEFTTSFWNPHTGYRLPKLTPRHFSFNSQIGACPSCHGLGTQPIPDPERIVPDPTKTLAEGAVESWWRRNPSLRHLQHRTVLEIAEFLQVPTDQPYQTLPPKFTRALFDGFTEKQKTKASAAFQNTKSKIRNHEGLCPEITRLYAEAESDALRRDLRRYLRDQPCPDCQGQRLKPEILAVTLPGPDQKSHSIHSLQNFNIAHLKAWLESYRPPQESQAHALPLLDEIRKRLRFLEEVGLGYLTLNRESGTLSGGESQRIRLAAQLGSSLAGVLYVLDEPSIGLHPADTERLIATLLRLRDLGNTVIVVEHDESILRAADHLIEMGPGAGSRGGHLMAQGSPQKLLQNPDSLTGAYLSGRKTVSKKGAKSAFQPSPHLPADYLELHGAKARNLRKVDLRLPLGRLTALCGVSGSGKSTLVDQVLRPALAARLARGPDQPGHYESLRGWEPLQRLVVVDQSPLGNSPRSNPATYTGIFGPIRELFAQLPLARQRGYDPGRFSFNTPGGRCEACGGAGSLTVDMHFLPSVQTPCAACRGKRFNRETLEITFKGRHISDVLDLEIETACDFFRAQPKIARPLRALQELGLGYLQLGQSAKTLSGGEAQRVKLAAELAKRQTNSTFFLLDEPTTGLHFEDIRLLLKAFDGLIAAGHTLLVIEHQLDVIQHADHILELGPGSGAEGGRLIFQGPPSKLAQAPTPTGQSLQRTP